jgi:hypothetical protein
LHYKDLFPPPFGCRTLQQTADILGKMHRQVLYMIEQGRLPAKAEALSLLDIITLALKNIDRENALADADLILIRLRLRLRMA